jgi:Ca-activated chloride channel family protein
MPVHAGNPLKEGIDAYNQGAYDKALKLFIDAQLDHPDRPDILYNIGNAYYHTGDYEAAAKNYKEALKTENKLLQQKAHYNLGNADFRKKKYEDALKNYEDALKLNPDDIQARQNLEFVKRVMEQSKEQQNQEQKGDNKDASEPKEPDKKNSAENKPSPDFGKEMSDQRESAGNDAEQRNTEDQKEQGNSPSKPADDPENSEEIKKADHILNRLKDQPGKAMIPAYGKTEVEKDW